METFLTLKKSLSFPSFLYFFDPSKTGIGEVMDIAWTINDPPGLWGLKK